MSDQLYQINVGYVAREDRLLMRISTRSRDEYRMWLTRRFTGMLLQILNRQMEQFGGAPTLASRQETRQMFKEGALDKSFEEEHAGSFPLGEAGVLAFRVNARQSQEGTLVLQILPEQGQGVTLNLNKTLLYLFYNVLGQGIEQAQWQLGDAKESSDRVH